MNKALVILFVIFSFSKSQAQVKVMNQDSDVIKLKRGDTLMIQVDSAYAIGYVRADFLNAKLDELDIIKNLYNNQVSNQRDLLLKIEELDELIMKFRSQAIEDSLLMSNRMNEVLSNLNSISKDLRNNNRELKKNNQDLELRIQNLNTIINDLRKELRGIWWNGITDKVIAFTAGLGTGLVIALLL